MVQVANACGSDDGNDFVDLAQQCAPQIVTETLAAVVSVESGFKPFAIRINSNYPLPISLEPRPKPLKPPQS